jgi:hypothetical protein
VVTNFQSIRPLTPDRSGDALADSNAYFALVKK